MPTSRAVVPTEHASRYLQQLCKHWVHKFDVQFTPQEGRIALPLGQALLAADDAALTIDLDVPKAEDARRMKEVVQSHVERFAFRETLQFDWS